MGRPQELSETEQANLAAQGLRPFEIWMPDFSDPETYALAVEEAKRIAFVDSEENVLDWLEALQKDMWEGEDQL